MVKSLDMAISDGRPASGMSLLITKHLSLHGFRMKDPGG
ncbi:hypothetical protein I552_3803 [Mycobacterium xenopi 3993]|nr:hypothetical protein I552_3803 [Mycobacterium xenopi 3993]